MSARGRWLIAVLALAVLVATFFVWRTVHEEPGPAAELEVTWDVIEGSPTCAYEPGADTATAHLVATGGAADHEVTATVTAYADENTSRLVGTGSTTIDVPAGEEVTFDVTIDLDRPPFIGEDFEAACRLEIDS